MNINKARHRSQLTEKYLISVLHIAGVTLKPNFDESVKETIQLHRPH